MNLYRFISFEDFVNLACNHKERFTRPVSWEDPYEGYTYAYMENKEDIHHLVRHMYDELSPGNFYAVADNFFKMWSAKWYSYAQCWSGHAETDAMWRCYSYGNHALRIRTTYQKLEAHAAHLFGEAKYQVTLRKVEYDVNTKQDVLRAQIACFRESRFSCEAYFHKRKAFQHEREYRLLIKDDSFSVADGLSSYGAQFNLHREPTNQPEEEWIEALTDNLYTLKYDYSKEKIEQVMIKEIDDLEKFIEGVMVHPCAEAWFVKMIEEICEKGKLKFEGQSRIYQLQKQEEESEIEKPG